MTPAPPSRPPALPTRMRAGPGRGGGTTRLRGRRRRPREHRRPAPETGAGQSRPQLGAFVDALGGLRRQLAVGLSYDQYTARVKALRADYEGVPIERLDLACLAASGTPGERAFNKYIDAANAWGDCLADSSCDTATIEPVLQRKWQVASHLLGETR